MRKEIAKFMAIVLSKNISHEKFDVDIIKGIVESEFERIHQIRILKTDYRNYLSHSSNVLISKEKYKTNDLLFLREYDAIRYEYSGRFLIREVNNVIGLDDHCDIAEKSYIVEFRCINQVVIEGFNHEFNMFSTVDESAEIIGHLINYASKQIKEMNDCCNEVNP